MESVSRSRHILRKTFACDECKRRKTRCSGDENCLNCLRDAKACRYLSPSYQLSKLQRRVQECERLISDIEKAWAAYLPSIDLQEASKIKHQHDLTHSTEQPTTSVAEHSNAEDYEFDESQDFDNSTDGMGFLTVDPHKAGYTGPQSGVAALKFLQSLSLYIPLGSFIPASSLDDDDICESTLGALAKPRDGSWPLLYNIVLAIGAFAGDSNGTKMDIVFFKEARKRLSMDVLEKGPLSYVQAIVLMANYLQKRNKPNAAFILVGIGFSMALAIGLHREFGMPTTSPFTMEVRRRVWWTFFIFVSGVQLILGRPAVSLVGVNVRLPANVDDHDLAVDMEELPESSTGPTLPKIANAIQVELLTHHLPSPAKAQDLEQRISSWHNDLSAHFDAEVHLEPKFDIPRRVVLWRSYHLRNVINRPFLFQNITPKSELDTSADMCVTSICGSLESTDNRQRGLTWYATCWLLTASFVQATCYVYGHTHPLAESWRSHIQRAVDCLGSLGSSHDMALRARAALQKVLEHGHERTSPGSFDPFSLSQPGPLRPPWSPAAWGENPALRNPFGQSFGSNLRYPQGSFGAEFLDAAGGLMIQNLFGSTEGSRNSSWTPD
ncbi:hypothetical protein BDW66DRAFT_165195 [Aspergillus desertorum]